MVTLKTLIHLPRKNFIREYVMPVIDCDVSNSPSIRWEDDVGVEREKNLALNKVGVVDRQAWKRNDEQVKNK
jgi:hypothetical protein